MNDWENALRNAGMEMCQAAGGECPPGALFVLFGGVAVATIVLMLMWRRGVFA